MTSKNSKAFTLVETLIGLAIIAIITAGLFGIFQAVSKSTGLFEARTIATNLATEQMELIRNLPYSEIGTTEGWPHGDIPSTSAPRNINNINYIIHTDVQYVDDIFDELAPLDPYNADYKKARVWVTWDVFPSDKPVVLVSNIVPKGQETIEDGGTLSIKVFNNQAAPVPQVNVHVENNSLTPNINISTQTNVQGELILPALPIDPSANYAITVTKTGYTSDYTVAPSVDNPSPVLASQAIQLGAITDISFTIDLTSSLIVNATGTQGGGSWWDIAYQYRQIITLQNNSPDILPAHSSIKFDLDHYNLVLQDKSQISGNDVRIVYFNGSAWQEISRINKTAWNTQATPAEIWFATQADLDGQGSTDNYYLYYGNASAGAPNIDLTQIFNPEKDSETAGLYYFENGQGQIVTDSSNNNYEGQITNADWANGVAGQALRYNSADSYVAIPVADNTPLDIEGQITLEAWVYLTEITGNQSVIDRLNNYALWLSNGYPSFGVFDQVAGLKSIQANNQISLNTWTHLAGIYSPGSLKIFINKDENNSKSETVTYLAVNSSDLLFGNGDNFGPKSSQFIGRIDEVRISSIAKSAFPYAIIPDVSVSLDEEETVVGANPISGLSLNIVGERPIGYDGEGNPIIRNQFLNQTTNASGQLILDNIEWDKYTITPQSADFDLAEISPPNPVNVIPGENQIVTLVLIPHASNTLRITVVDSAKDPIANAEVHIFGNGTDQTKITSSAGQVFFSPLEALNYNLEASKSGFDTFTGSQDVSGQTTREIILAPAV